MGNCCATPTVTGEEARPTTNNKKKIKDLQDIILRRSFSAA